MSNEEVAETIHRLMSLLCKIEDKKLKGDLEDQIIALCDQLKFTMIIDKVKEKKANEK
jgi:hypothetical protein|tara:strand:- start:341 stop:514 length:174 start_codon:yes stop_codon:yes gene_type:complete